MNESDLLQIFTGEGKDLDWWQMGCRALIVYLAVVLIVRLGKKRLFGKSAAIDVVLGVLLGSVVSRAINGSAKLFPTLLAGAILVLLHALSVKLTLWSSALGTVLKGNPQLLVKDGALCKDAMARSDISEHDLIEAARFQGRVETIDKIAEAHLERNGRISIVPLKPEPKVLEVKVENGVQTVRIEIAAS